MSTSNDLQRAKAAGRGPPPTNGGPRWPSENETTNGNIADEKRAEYSAVSDTDAVAAARLLATTEGIIPALESAHAIAGLIQRAPKMSKDDLVILNLSGRGDKDMDTYSRLL